ncbi:MAG TPA: helix-turn-helix transcriptional regulator [Ktedonobacteraceae bacterium]
MERSEATDWMNKLRQERLARHWRQRDLAEHLHTAVLTVNRWERGRQQPSAYFCLKLCALFGKSAEEMGFCSPGTQTLARGEREISRLTAMMSLVAGPTAPEEETAELLMLRVLHIREQELGADHPLTAVSLNILAQIYQEQEVDERAEPLLRRSLEICKRLLGLYHPDTAACFHQLARFYQRQGHYSRAEQYYQQALAIREALFGAEHPSIGAVLCDLASLYQAQDKPQQALASYQHSLKLAELFFGPQRASMDQTSTSYAALLRKRGRSSDVLLEAWHLLNT